MLFRSGVVAASERLKTGVRIAFLGDSIMQHNNESFSTGSALNEPSMGELAVAQAMFPAFDISTWVDTSNSPTYFQGANRGVVGQTSAQIKARLSDTLLMTPDVLVIGGCGTNDLPSYPATSLATIIQNNEDMVNSARAAYPNMPIILALIRPWGPTRASSPDPSLRQQVNDALRAFVPTVSRCYLWDTETPYLGSDGYAIAGYLNTADDLHPVTKGAFATASGLVAILRQIIGDGNYFLNLPNANIMPGVPFGGTGGAVPGSGITGTVLDTFTVVKSGTVNSSVVCSTEDNPDTGAKSQVITITPSGAQAFEKIVFRPIGNGAGTIVSTALQNQWARLVVEYELDNWAYWSNAYASLRVTTNFQAVGLSSSTPSTLTANAAGRYWAATPPFLFDGTHTGYQPSVTIPFLPNGASGTGVIKIRRAFVKLIDSPLPAWGF